MTTFQASFSQSFAATDIVLVVGQIDGKDAWRYLRVEKNKRIFFEKALKSGSLTPNDFGEVLYAGWGETPPVYIENLVKLEQANN